MVFNVSKEDIRVRMAAVDEENWPTDPTRSKKRDPSAGDTLVMSRHLLKVSDGSSLLRRHSPSRQVLHLVL